MGDSDFNQLRIPLRIDRNLAYQIAQQRKSDAKHESRTSKRFSIQYGTRIRVEFDRADGQVLADAITKDMSDDGLGLWVGAFIHPKTKCAVTIPTDTGGTIEIEGEVRWCKHFTQAVHEVGIAITSSNSMGQVLEETLAGQLKTMASDFADVCTGVEALIFGVRSKIGAGLTPEELSALVSQLEHLVHQDNIEFLTTTIKAQVEESKRDLGGLGRGESRAA